MLLAYAYCPGPNSEKAVLCITPLKPDQFSCAVPVRSLIPTHNAICRLSPSEGIRVYEEPGITGFVIEPMVACKLYLTVSQPDRPGFDVKMALIKFVDDVKTEIYYKQKDRASDWKIWQPNIAADG